MIRARHRRLDRRNGYIFIFFYRLFPCSGGLKNVGVTGGHSTTDTPLLPAPVQATSTPIHYSTVPSFTYLPLLSETV